MEQNRKQLFILQGRLNPDYLDCLQVFPEKQWQKEMAAAHNIGFNGLELLYDKKLKFIDLCYNKTAAKDLLLNWCRNGYVASICLDYFAFQDYKSPHFWQHLISTIKIINELNIKTAILPLLTIKKKEQLRCFLRQLEENILVIDSCFKPVIALEINLSAAAIHDCMETFQSTNIGVCFDTGNSRAHGYQPEQEIKILNNLIRHIHIKDVNNQGENSLLGCGLVDFKKCFKALDEIQYSGNLVFETAYFNVPHTEAMQNYHYLIKQLDLK